MWTLQTVINLITTKIRNATRNTKISNVDLADVMQSNAEFVNERYEGMVETFNAMSTVYIDRFSNLMAVFYVNQATGNDTNSGLTEALAFKTLDRVRTLVNNKFTNVEIRIIGNYNQMVYTHFQVSNLLISLQANTTFTFKSFLNNPVGYATYPIVFEGNQLTMKGENITNLVVEGHTGWAAGFGNNYYYHSEQGAIRAGNAGIQYLQCRVQFINFNKVTVGANTSMLTGREGNSSHFSQPHLYFEFNRVATWEILAPAPGGNGVAGKICVTCRQSYFRKSLLFSVANEWITVADQGELNLLTGAHSVRAVLDTSPGGGYLYYGHFSGIMSWYYEGMNDGQFECREIALHGIGVDLNGRNIRLRTVTTGTVARLEATLDHSLSGPITVEFFFSKLD